MKLVHTMIGTFSYMRYSYHGDFMIPSFSGHLEVKAMTSLTIPPLSKHQSKMMIVSQETLRKPKRRKAPAQVFAPPPSRESGDQRPENNLQGCGCRIRPGRGLLPLEASPDVIRPMYFKALHCPWPVACCKVYTLQPSKSLNTTNKTQPRQPSQWH